MAPFAEEIAPNRLWSAEALSPDAAQGVPMQGESLDMMMRRGAAEGRIDVVRASLRRGSAVDSTERNGRTALMNAAMGGHTEVCKLLLDSGGNVNAPAEGGGHPLMYGVRSGKERLVRVLLDSGAAVDARADGGHTALMIAARRGHVRVGETLISRGAIVDSKSDDGWTALMAAASEGHDLMAMMLMSSRASASITDAAGRTAEAIALEAGHATLAAKLAAQAEVEAMNRMELERLTRSAGAGEEQSVEGVPGGRGEQEQSLQQVLSSQDVAATALMVRDAAKRGKTTALGKLLASPAGSNPEIFDGASPETGYTALWLAARESQIVAMEMLAGVGADVNLACTDGRTPLMLAATRSPAALNLLLKAGADWTKVDNAGQTAEFKAMMMAKNKADPERSAAAAETLATLQSWATSASGNSDRETSRTRLRTAQERALAAAELEMKRQTRELQEKKMELKQQEILAFESIKQSMMSGDGGSDGSDGGGGSGDEGEPTIGSGGRGDVAGEQLDHGGEQQEQQEQHDLSSKESLRRRQQYQTRPTATGGGSDGGLLPDTFADMSATVLTLQGLANRWMAELDLARAWTVAALLFPVICLVLRGAGQVASMKTALDRLQAVEEERLTCPICLERYDERYPERMPRVAIGCGHTFCAGCITTMLTTLLGTAANPGHKALTCPTCRHVTEVPRGQSARLPVNFVLLD
jgi:ankyrin repeat protein